MPRPGLRSLRVTLAWSRKDLGVRVPSGSLFGSVSSQTPRIRNFRETQILASGKGSTTTFLDRHRQTPRVQHTTYKPDQQTKMVLGQQA